MRKVTRNAAAPHQPAAPPEVVVTVTGPAKLTAEQARGVARLLLAHVRSERQGTAKPTGRA